MENAQSQNIFATLLPFLIIIVVFYFFLIRPQRIQQKKHKEMISSLSKGDKVVTTGGFICEVLRVEEKFFLVKLNDETTAKLAKEYIAFKMEDSTPDK